MNDVLKCKRHSEIQTDVWNQTHNSEHQTTFWKKQCRILKMKRNSETETQFCLKSERSSEEMHRNSLLRRLLQICLRCFGNETTPVAKLHGHLHQCLCLCTSNCRISNFASPYTDSSIWGPDPSWKFGANDARAENAGYGMRVGSQRSPILGVPFHLRVRTPLDAFCPWEKTAAIAEQCPSDRSWTPVWCASVQGQLLKQIMI